MYIYIFSGPSLVHFLEHFLLQHGDGVKTGGQGLSHVLGLISCNTRLTPHSLSGSVSDTICNMNGPGSAGTFNSYGKVTPSFGCNGTLSTGIVETIFPFYIKC